MLGSALFWYRSGSIRLFILMPIQIRMRIGIKTMLIYMRIHIGTGKIRRVRPDPDPQHCFILNLCFWMMIGRILERVCVLVPFSNNWKSVRSAFAYFASFILILPALLFLFLECIPLALAENCGLHPINTLTEIKAKQVPNSRHFGWVIFYLFYFLCFFVSSIFACSSSFSRNLVLREKISDYIFILWIAEA